MVRLELHHKDGDYQNSTRENAERLCVPCHKKDHYAHGRTKAGRKGLRTEPEEIISIEEVGVEEVYDVEMAAPYHTFTTDTGIVTCNSHAASYAILAYQTAYLRAYWPVEFMTAVLKVFGAEKKDKAKYLRACQAMRIDVQPPDVNHSERDFVARGGKIYYGMQAVKGVSEQAVTQILAARERARKVKERDAASSEGPVDLRAFSTFEEFVRRVMTKEGNKVTTRDVEHLILVGSFDELGERQALIKQLAVWADWATKIRDVQRGKRKSTPIPPEMPADPAPMQLEEKLRWELELLGQFVSGHPMDGFDALSKMVQAMTKAIPAAGSFTNGEISRGEVVHFRPFLGYVTSVDVRALKSGNRKGMRYGIIKLLVGDDTFTFMAWPEALTRYRAYLQPGERIVAIARIRSDAEDPAKASYDLELALSASEMITDMVRLMVIEPKREEDLPGIRTFLERLPPGGQHVVVKCGEDVYEGPSIDLSPSRLGALSRMARVNLY